MPPSIGGWHRRAPKRAYVPAPPAPVIRDVVKAVDVVAGAVERTNPRAWRGAAKQNRQAKAKRAAKAHRKSVARGRRAKERTAARKFTEGQRRVMARAAFMNLGEGGGPSLRARHSGDLFGSFGSVDKANYEGYMRRLWPKVVQEFGLTKAAPMPDLNFDDDRESSAAYVMTDKPPGERTVNIAPSAYYGAQLRPGSKRYVNKGAARYARQVPIHEWAHVFQTDHVSEADVIKLTPSQLKRLLKRQDVNAEGGAEAFSQYVAKKLGRVPGQMAYDEYVRDVRRRKGKRWIRKGQFE